MDSVFRDAGGSQEREFRELRIEREFAASTQISSGASFEDKFFAAFFCMLILPFTIFG